METRKVQQVGGGTYTVSIPVHWANEHGVEAGCTAYLYTHGDGSLVVRWDEQEEQALAATTIEVTDADPDTVETLLDAAYATGFKEITLRSSETLTAAQRRSVTARVRTLGGVDVVEVADSHLVVRGLLDAGDVSVGQSVRQLRFVAHSMHQAAMDAFGGTTPAASHVAQRRSEPERLAARVERHCSRSLVELGEVDRLGVTRPELYRYCRVARALEGVAGEAVRIAEAVQGADSTPEGDLANRVRTVGDRARDAVDTATESVLGDGDGAAALAASNRCARIREEADSIDDALCDAPPDAAHLLTRVLDCSVRIAEYADDIADLAHRASLRT